MKKFNALLFAMALVAVVAFASVAFAATQFLGVDTNGKVVVINVDPTKTSQKVTYEGYTITGAPKIGDDDKNSTVKAFGYEGGVVVISTDALDANTKGAKVYTFKTNDSGNFEYGKVYTELASNGKLSGDIRGVVTMQGNPVILATKAIATISNDKLSAIAISDDIPFVYNSNLYIVSADGVNAGGKIFEFKGVNDVEGAVVNSTSTTIVSREIVCPTGGTVLTNADVSTVTIDNTIYIAAARVSGSGSFDKIVIPTGSANFMDTSAFAIKPVDVLSDGNYFALFNKDGALYALEKRSDNDLYLVEMTIASSKVTKTTILEKLSADVKGANDGTGSFDIYITDDVIGVINHGHAFAVFTANSDGGWDFVESKDFKTAAMVATASTTPDTPDTPTTTSTVVDPSTLETAAQTNLVENTPATAITDFVTATEASTTTVPTGAQAAIEAELKKDDKTTVTLAAKTNYTPAKDGYILVKEAVDVSKVTVYFVEAATTTAAVGDLTTAYLLDADCKEMGSTGTSVYAASDKLESGKTYTLVEATVSTSPDDDNTDTGSSSSGCNAGFAAVSALLALAFIKKSR